MTYVIIAFLFLLMQKLFIHVETSAKNIENAILVLISSKNRVCSKFINVDTRASTHSSEISTDNLEIWLFSIDTSRDTHNNYTTILRVSLRQSEMIERMNEKREENEEKKLQIPFSDEWALTYALFSSLLLSFALFHIHSDDGRNLSLTNCKNRKISNPLNEEKKSLVWLNLCLQWNVEFFPLFLSTLKYKNVSQWTTLHFESHASTEYVGLYSWHC